MIIDQKQVSGRLWDVCIVGSGPVGMSLALEFERLGRDVLLLEAGKMEPDESLAEDTRAHIRDPQRHVPMEIAVCRAFGGTSWLWGGRCVPYDDVDFVSRPFVPHSDWPVTHDEIKPWYAPTAAYMLCGSGEFERAPVHLPAMQNVSASSLERWSAPARIVLKYRASFERSSRISVCVKSPVVELDFDPQGTRLDQIVIIVDGGRKAYVKAKSFILATGGVETTRLLLAAQRSSPTHFGGKEGPLGRYYMGHISGKIADIVFKNPAAVADLDFELDQSVYVRRRFVLTKEAQLAHKVQNTVFWPDNAPFYDPEHRSAVLSAVFLALAMPPVGRRLASEGIRLAHIGSKPRRYGAHIANLVFGGPRGIKSIAQILKDRFLSDPRKPGFLVTNSAGKYALHYHAEQQPNPESRIRLSGETDRYGLPRVDIDIRFVEADVQSVVVSHEVLDSALQAAGIGRLEYRYAKTELRDRVWAQAADGYHQAGTTRMSVQPCDGVVDPNLKVHGLANLYIASSSVFPSAGQANSTFLAVALGLRLAHHLHSSISN
jgi:choline dehydrogenase-like flavoprotein